MTSLRIAKCQQELASDSADRRLNGLLALIDLISETPSAWTALIQVAACDDEPLRERAIASLEDAGSPPPDAVPALAALLQSLTPEATDSSEASNSEWPTASGKGVSQAKGSSAAVHERRVAYWTATLLGRTAGTAREHASLLQKTYERIADESTRQQILWAIGNIGSDDPAIARWLKSLRSENPRTKRMIQAALSGAA
jgi:hypothetical protein